MVFEKVTLIDRCNEHFEGAVEDAIGKVQQTPANLRWASVTNYAVGLNCAEREFQVEVEVAFEPQKGVA